MEGQRRRQAIICDAMRNEELTRVEGGGIDCRTVGACWLCGVHDKRSKPATVAAATTAAATYREIVGLAKFRGWTRCRKNKLDPQVVGFPGGVEGCGGQARWIDGQQTRAERRPGVGAWCRPSAAQHNQRPRRLLQSCHAGAQINISRQGDEAMDEQLAMAAQRGTAHDASWDAILDLERATGLDGRQRKEMG